jgi:DNA modification methylase
MTWREEILAEGVRLICGDCLEVLPTLGKVDAIVTDPPYGVNGGSGTLGAASSKTKYTASFDDTPDYVRQVVIPAVALALSLSSRGCITPGTPCAFLYPQPDDMGAIYQPATPGLNKWGRETTQPVLFYGKDPRAGLTIQAKHIQATIAAEKNGHPCPKPDYVAKWMVQRASLDGETVLDPFMGSGTTGVAAVKLGRKFIGIEIEPRYFDIACRRISDALKQPDMFIERPTPPKQEAML